jgi:hypothetical protein
MFSGNTYCALDLSLALYGLDDQRPLVDDLPPVCCVFHFDLPPPSCYFMLAKPGIRVREGMGGNVVYHISDPLVIG